MTNAGTDGQAEVTTPGPGLKRVSVLGAAAINCYIVAEADGSLTLVDTGLRRSRSRIQRAVEALGAELGDVRRIIVTHAHPDHAGSVAALAEASGATVLAHQADRAYIEEGRAAPSDERFLLGRLANVRPPRFGGVSGVQAVVDGEQLDGGLTIIHLPGHTPGHIGVKHEASGTLMAADALFHIRKLTESPRFLCNDAALARQSANRLAELEFETIAFGHGPELGPDERTKLEAFLPRT